MRSSIVEAAGGGDVLELDRGERRRDMDDRLDDLVGVLGVEEDGHAGKPGQGLDQAGLALHDRHGRLGPDVAQAEDGRAVGDDGDEVADGGVAAGEGRVVLDLEADLGHARACRPRRSVLSE